MEYILITGVSSGIGYETTQHLLEKGYFVFGSVRKQADAERLNAEFGERFQALLFDVTDRPAIDRAVQEVEDVLGPSKGLALLVNNAGIVEAGPLQHMEMERFRNQLEVNVFGLLQVTQAFLPLLGASKPATRPPGKIINISSISGIFTSPFTSAYSVSKFAVESLTDGLRRELFIFGIDVLSIQPGPVKTPIWGKAIKHKNTYPGTAYEPILKNMDKMIRHQKKNAIEPSQVAFTVYKMLTQTKPATRTIVDKRATLLKFLSKLPPRWLDYLLTKRIKERVEK